MYNLKAGGLVFHGFSNEWFWALGQLLNFTCICLIKVVKPDENYNTFFLCFCSEKSFLFCGSITCHDLRLLECLSSFSIFG